MPDPAEAAGSAAASGKNFLTQKIGPLPLIAWVGIGAGLVAVLVALRNRQGGSTQTVDLLGVNALQSQLIETTDNLNNQLAGIYQGQVAGASASDAGVFGGHSMGQWQTLIRANPSLLDPAYEGELMRSRGFVFFQDEQHANGLPVLPPQFLTPGLEAALLSNPQATGSTGQYDVGSPFQG